MTAARFRTRLNVENMLELTLDVLKVIYNLKSTIVRLGFLFRTFEERCEDLNSLVMRKFGIMLFQVYKNVHHLFDRLARQ